MGGGMPRIVDIFCHSLDIKCPWAGGVVSMAQRRDVSLGLATEPMGTWLQTDREAHELWGQLALQHPKAAALLHVILARMGRHNALVASIPTLAGLVGVSRNTLVRAIDVLRSHRRIDVRQVGGTGTANCYIVNSRVAWSGARDGIRYALFDAAVLVSSEEQPDQERLDAQEPLRRVPELFAGERQLPSGPGLPPVSQPSLMGLEPDLPAKART